MNSTVYEQQAQDFLTKHEIKFRATLSDSKVAPRGEENHSHHWRVTISGPNPLWGRFSTKPNRRLTFDFWAGTGIKQVTAYCVLSCISSDVHCAETFGDFCCEFGESADSIKALQTFRRCSAFAKRLREFFTAEEIADLQEVQ